MTQFWGIRWYYSGKSFAFRTKLIWHFGLVMAFVFQSCAFSHFRLIFYTHMYTHTYCINIYELYRCINHSLHIHTYVNVSQPMNCSVSNFEIKYVKICHNMGSCAHIFTDALVTGWMQVSNSNTNQWSSSNQSWCCFFSQSICKTFFLIIQPAPHSILSVVLFYIAVIGNNCFGKTIGVLLSKKWSGERSEACWNL